MSEPRAYTSEEVRQRLLEHIATMICYWRDTVNVTNYPDLQGIRDMETYRMSGLVFSILAALDGSSLAVPAFKLLPICPEADKAFFIGEGENWYSEDEDVGGALHEEWKNFEPKERK